jgi:hypothetical protein
MWPELGHVVGGKVGEASGRLLRPGWPASMEDVAEMAGYVGTVVLACSDDIFDETVGEGICTRHHVFLDQLHVFR